MWAAAALATVRACLASLCPRPPAHCAARLHAPPGADPLSALLALEPPAGSSKYCPTAALMALAGSEWQGPTGGSKYCMVAAALDAAAGWAPPTGASKYDVVSAVLAYEPPAGAGAGRWDPLGWLLDGWAANSGGWEVPRGASPLQAIQPPSGGSRYDPAHGLADAVRPPSGSSRYDPLKQVVAGATAPAGRPAKFDPVADLLAGGRGGCDREEGLAGAGGRRWAARSCLAAGVGHALRSPLGPLGPRLHSQLPLPPCALPPSNKLTGEWLDTDYKQQVQQAANSAASRLFGSPGAAGAKRVQQEGEATIYRF